MTTAIIMIVIKMNSHKSDSSKFHSDAFFYQKKNLALKVTCLILFLSVPKTIPFTFIFPTDLELASCYH